MKISFLYIILFVVHVACVPTPEVSKTDASKLFVDKKDIEGNNLGNFGQDENASEQWAQVSSILAAKCILCHSPTGSYSQADFKLTEDELLNSRFIVKGSPEQSSFYYRLKGASLEQGNETMPISFNLSSSERMLIYNWIKSSEISEDNPQDNTSPLVTLDIQGLSGSRIMNNPLTVQGSCETNLPVGLNLIYNNQTFNFTTSCQAQGSSNIGSYSYAINLSEYGSYSIQAAQVDLSLNEGSVTRNFQYTSIDSSCDSSQEFVSFKAALTAGHCYDCHGDDPTQQYGSFRAFDSCEEDWSKATINGTKMVQAGRTLQSRIYTKLHGSGVNIDGLRMPPFRSNLRTQEEFNSVLSELNSNNSQIRRDISAWIETLDNAQIESINVNVVNNLLVASAQKDDKETQYIKFDLLNSQGVVIDSQNSVASPYQVTFITSMNGTYSVRASAIEYSYDPNNPSEGISSSMTSEAVAVNYVPNDNGGGTTQIDILNGVQVEYFSDSNFQNKLTVNSMSIVENINMSFSGNNNYIHPEYSNVVDNFSVRFKGFLSVPATGAYTFIANVDDNINLTINGSNIISHLTGGNNIINSDPVNLTAGQLYPYTLEYQESVFDGQIILSWVGPNIAEEVIPAQNFHYSPQIQNSGLSILVPQINSNFVDVIPSLSGNCIQGSSVILANDVQTPMTQMCNSQTRTFNFENVQLSNGDGNKTLIVRQVISGHTFSSERIVVKDMTPPNLTMNNSPNENASVYSGVIISGQCEAGTNVFLGGSAIAQSTPCNNTYSFIANFTEASGPVTITVSQSDPLGNMASLNRTYNLSNARDLASANIERQNFQDSCTSENNAGTQGISTLTKLQYENTLNDLFNFSFREGLLSNIQGSLQLVDDIVPTAELTTIIRYKRTVKHYPQQSLSAFERIANNISNYIFDDNNRANEFTSNCISNPNETCVLSFINNFGKKVYRRPLNSDESALLLTLFNEEQNTQNGFKLITYSMLQSPYFLYRLENEGQENEDYVELTDYEIISRISYQYLDTMPDDYLFSQADRSGDLTQSEISNIIDYIFQNSQYREKLLNTLWHFYSEWLEVEYGKTFAISERANTISNGLYSNTTEASQLRDAMVDELKTMLEYYFDNNGTLQDILTSDKTFTNNTDLAELYGVSVFNGVVNQSHTKESRFGIFTSPAYLSSSLDYVNTFRRGAHLHKYALCGSFSAVTPATPSPPNFDREAIQTNRQLFKSLVPEGSSCMDCHNSINNMGFAFEEYNYLGQFKNGGIEPIVNDEGDIIAQLAVNAISSPTIGGVNYSVNGAKDLISKAISSRVIQACFSKQYFRYFYGRLENVDDSCSINSLFERSLNSPIKEVFKEVGKRSAFRRRKFQ